MNDFISQLYWREPLWLILSFFPLLIIIWKRSRQQQHLKQYADTDLLPWVTLPNAYKKNQWENILQFIIWFLFSIAAAGPRLLIYAPENILPPQSAAIIVIDHSRSMQANDIFPSRQQVTGGIIKQWSQHASTDYKNNIKLGLVVFAGASHILLPATSDMHALYENAQLLPEIQLPTHGSALSEALIQSKALLKNIPGNRNIILLSDGDIEEYEFINLKKIIKELQQEGITLQILGVGLPSPVALIDTAGHWLKFKGQAVMTRLKEKELKQLSEINNVTYTRLKPNTHNKLSNLWKPKNAFISGDDINKASWNELFYAPLLAALLLIIFKNVYLKKINPFRLFIVFLAYNIFTLSAYDAHADNSLAHTKSLKQAYHAWEKKEYTKALALYSKTQGYIARMGEGASCFRLQKFDCAITSFSRAAWLAKNKQQRGQAAFNLANSFFKQGDFNSAIQLYKDALRYQPEQNHYSNNLAFTIEVQHNIERYLRLIAKRNKRFHDASGDASSDIEASINFNDNRISTLDLNSQALNPPNISKDITLTLKKNSALTQQQLAMYIQSEQNFLKLSASSQKKQQKAYDWGRFSQGNPIAAKKVEFWQRLFELEEDIPAHPQTPKVLEDVRPW